MRHCTSCRLVSPTMLALRIIVLAVAVASHSWIDSIFETSDPSNIGYPRAYAGHDADVSITTYKVLNRDPSTAVCGPSQMATTYSSRYPELVVAAGSTLTGVYSENGHVTKDHLLPDDLPVGGVIPSFSTLMCSILVITLGIFRRREELYSRSPT